MSCDVCFGLTTYPIINRFGTTLYEITCPECFGTGMSDTEYEHDLQHREDLERYNTAMGEMRARETEDHAAGVAAVLPEEGA